jgi:N-acetylglucosamine-6-phosphate deacetylase
MNAAAHAVAASHVFDGTAVQRDAAVVIEGERIAAVVPRTQLPPGLPVRVLQDGIWLAPGFIDIQVNGGGDVLFNDQPTEQAIEAIVVAHRQFGTTALLPTLITDTPDKMPDAIVAAEAAGQRLPGVVGIHLEGPFLSPERPGVHDASLIRLPTDADVELIAARRRGVTVVTLAPERMPAGLIGRLAEAGIRVSLGHSNASYQETRAAIAEGLTGFTHLFNAMPWLRSREPGPIAAALENASVFYGMIVDGVHVDPAMLKLALRGASRPMLVTDAMPPVGGRKLGFRLYGQEIKVAGDRCVRADGTLAGAMLDMASAIRNCVQMLDVSLERALAFASTHPADFLGLGDRLGRLRPGLRADLVAFDPQGIKVVATWVAGA